MEQNMFYSGILQHYLVFIPANKYIKYFSGTTRIDLWKSNGMSEENIKNMTKSDSNFALDISFNGHYLTNNNISSPKKALNLYISYKLNSWFRNVNTYFTLNNYLFESLKLTKNADLDKYKHSGYGIEFDPRLEFSSLHYNRSNSFLFVTLIKYMNLKQKTLKLKIIHCV